MDPSEIPSLDPAPPACDVIAHLQWTLAVDWRTVLDSYLPATAAEGNPLQPGWRERATSWRTGEPGTNAWAKSLDPSQTPSWQAMQQAHAAAGLDPTFRSEPTTSGDRNYGWYQDLERRMIRKFDVDGQNNVSPLARAIRGFLDITHTRPFEDGNTRAACTWVVWSLAGASIDIADLSPLIELPKPPGPDTPLRQIVDLLK